MAHGAWRMAHGAWRTAHGARRMALGALIPYYLRISRTTQGSCMGSVDMWPMAVGMTMAETPKKIVPVIEKTKV
jgi:hypothetical protein